MVLLPPPLQLFVRGLGPRGSSYCRETQSHFQQVLWEDTAPFLSQRCNLSSMSCVCPWVFSLLDMPETPPKGCIDALWRYPERGSEPPQTALPDVEEVPLLLFLCLTAAAWAQPPSTNFCHFSFFYFTNWPQLVITLEMQNKMSRGLNLN